MSRKRRRPTPAPGYILDSLYPTLDLHGDTADEARRRTIRWLQIQQEAGESTVRIVTGRGLHSIGPPVLPGEVEQLLTELRGSRVSRFSTESGGGVFRVELKRAERPPGGSILTPSKQRARSHDPRLRRAAEESLSELGITPTPELLEAEMERLAREEGGIRE